MKAGYIFNGWNTTANDSGTSYADKQSVINLVSVSGGSITLYAQWKPITYTIAFHGNGYTRGSTASMSMTYDTAKALTANGFARASYKFTGWNTKADGSGTKYTDKQSVKNLTTVNGATVMLYAQWEYNPNLSVDECDVYDGQKNNKTLLYGISKGNTFSDYTYKTDYPTIDDTVWFNVYFSSETKSIKVRQYVKNGGDWVTRDVTLSASSTSSQWFPVKFSGKYMTIDADTNCYTVQAKTDWIDSNGKVLKSGTVHTFYIPVKPVVHRTQVSARSYEGSIYAYNGTNGSKGAVYSGQHIKIGYKYTADNTWSAVEQLKGSMYNYNGSSWETVYKQNGGWDAVMNNIGVRSGSPVTLQSAIGTYTVPKTTQNKLRFKLTSAWSSDTAHTTETTWIELPVIPSDIALKQIRLVDTTTGRELDPLNLEAGQKVKVQYIYKNNTNARVYIEGYTTDKEKIDGVYSIPANSTAYLPGYSFTVPNKRTFTLWGGIYLEGMGIYNTDYETDGTNNALTLQCKVNHPLKLIPIAQNADYREGTDVITSFWLNNTYTDEYTPASNISVKFNVYKGSTLIKTITKTQVVVPGSEKNLLYFKWTVPTGLNGANVKITGEIIDGGVSYNKVTAAYSTALNTVSATPDTQFEKKAPTGFTIPTSPSQSNGSAVWWEWIYSNGAFKKVNYGIAINSASAVITPATGETAVKNGSVWTMKSGYALSLSLRNSLTSVSGYSTPTNSAYTFPQYAIATFPEFGYSNSNGKHRTLKLSSITWGFADNGSYGNVHFTPLWYPDGNYTVNVVQSDCWTPAGMIKRSVNANTVKISQSAYDDWYVGR